MNKRIIKNPISRTSVLMNSGPPISFPSTPGPIRIDRFIEKRFNVVHSYEDLGEGILGLTKFGPSGVKAIMVARSLEEDGSLAQLSL